MNGHNPDLKEDTMTAYFPAVLRSAMTLLLVGWAITTSTISMAIAISQRCEQAEKCTINAILK